MTLELHKLPGGKASKRVGRGNGSGSGKTAGRGTKGQKSRTGHHYMPIHFEGGQMPLTQRIPKLRGFRNPRTEDWTTVTLKQLAKVSGATVNIDSLRSSGVVSRRARYIKIVGNDKLDRKLNVTAERISKGAAKSITAAGGTVKELKAKEVEQPKAADGQA